MKQLKNYFSGWDTSRIIRLVLGVASVIGYFYTRENIYLFAGVLLGLPAVLNISCPGGSCGTSAVNEEKPVVKLKKYEPKK